MRAITLYQPWAFLIALLLKRFETRSWAVKMGKDWDGTIAIHAGADRSNWNALQHELRHYRSGKYTSGNGSLADIYWQYQTGMLPNGLRLNEPMPFSGVLCICKIVDCIEMTPEFIAQQTREERAVGGWEPGRFAWQLEMVEVFKQPIPAKGGQGIWHWKREGVA